MLQHVNRIDIVWDDYISDSLKAETRRKRGKGVRKRVEPSSPIPGNWSSFLRVEENKIELFAYLATCVTSVNTDKQIISTEQANVLCTQSRDVSMLAPCTQEEADTRIFLHVNDIVNEGHSKISIRTVDTDVLILAVTVSQSLNMIELWVAFGTGKHFRFIAAHEIANTLGPNRCTALPLFHAFTGCDTVSFFSGRGKRTAWNNWMAFGDVTQALCTLVDTPDAIETCIQVLERFVVLMYERTSNLSSVNQARMQLFTQKDRMIDNIPPTHAALVQHTKRAIYQGVHCWGQMMVATPDLPPPDDWGWKRRETGGWDVNWTTLPEATDVCRELLRCRCQKGCKTRCKCVKAALECTALCQCGDQCSRK